MEVKVRKNKSFLFFNLITLLQILIILSFYSNTAIIQASNLVIDIPTIYETNSLDNANSILYSQELIKYNPVNNVSGIGSSFTAKDIMNVYDEQNLNLTYNSGNENFEDIYFINPISGFTPYSLQYNLTNITAKADWYPVESNTDATLVEIGFNEDRIAVAQAFEVKWDYALFMGAKIYLDYIGNTNPQNLELIIVKADEVLGYPDMSYEYTNDINDPYDNTNQIPPSTIDNIVFYNFTDVVLERGTYFIVANVTNPTASAKNYGWFGNTLGDDDGDTYFRALNGSWSFEPTIDLTCIPFLLPSDEFGDPLEITNPLDIILQDNGEDILSLTYPISSIGSHTITSDTSVEITFNNSYCFSHDHAVTSTYKAINSTFGDYSIYWNLTWSGETADPSPYSSFNRSFLVLTPIDWSPVSVCYYNESEILTSVRIDDGYLISLGHNNSAGDFSIETSSTNYIQDITLLKDGSTSSYYYLGYWTNDGETAFGYPGSIITADVDINNNVVTGEMNFTIFNPNGSLLPLKTSLPSNLSYVDTSMYTQSGITYSSPGVFTSSITFDPSVYGSDDHGSWSAFVFWNNGTEVGIFSKEISVQYATRFNLSWEAIPGSSQWSSNNGESILRKNGDALNLRAIYSSISEPYFNEYGHIIPDSNITYSTSWGMSGNFSNNYPNYNLTFAAYVTAGMYSIDVETHNGFCESHSLSVDLEIFNTYRIEPLESYVEVNSTDNLVLAFSMINETDPVEGVIFPDSIELLINSDPVSSGFYTQETEGDFTLLSIRIGAYGITVGTANVTVVVTKNGFRSGYNSEPMSFDFEVKVFPGTTPFEFPFYYYIIIGASVGVIILLSITLVTVSRSRKKISETFIDTTDKAKIVGLLDSVLAMKKILFIHSESSLPVYELDIGGGSSIDIALVSGFLGAVGQMGKEIAGSETGDIRKLEYRNFVVNSVSSDTYTTFLFSTSDITREFTARLFDLVMWFSYTFPIKQEVWDGKKEVYVKNKKLIEDKIADTLYLWIYFPVEVNPRKESEMKKLEEVNPKIIVYAMKKKLVTLSEIIKKFSEQPLEDVLISFFTMVNKGFLIRKQFQSYASGSK
jgi:hypothetical protein